MKSQALDNPNQSVTLPFIEISQNNVRMFKTLTVKRADFLGINSFGRVVLPSHLTCLMDRKENNARPYCLRFQVSK